jgi:iron complex outermembrane receptor protein
MRSALVCVCLALLELTAFSARAGAQDLFSIRGRVADRQGGAVVGAAVTLTPASGPVQTRQSNAEGTFEFSGLRGADYTLQVQSPGFAAWSQVLRIASDRTDLSVTLDVAGLSETVGVVGTGVSPLVVPAPTASRLGLTPLETPASLTVVTGEVIRERADVTIEDAETRIVGITSQGAPGNGGSSRMSRGFGGHNSLMKLYDGTQLFVASGTLTFPFDTWSVERLEFLGGPASVMYGNGAIGGVVNVVPRRPNRFTTENALRLAVGTQNTLRAAFGRGGPINDRVAYRIDLSQNSSDGYVERGNSKSSAVSGSMSFAVTPRLDFTVSEDFGYQEPMEYFGSVLLNGQLNKSLRKVNYNVEDAEIHYKDSWTQFRTEWRPLRNMVVRNNFNVLVSKRFWHNVETYAYVPATDLVTRSSYLEIFHDQLQYGNHAEATISTSIGGKTNTTSFGLDYSWTRFKHTNNSPSTGTSTVPLTNPNPGLFLNVGGTSPDFISRQDQYAVFVENRLVLDRHWSLVAGARVDRYDINRNALRLGTQATREFTPANWRGGVVYSVRPDISIYGQYATATDAVGTLLTLSPAQQLFDLTPGRQVEVGAKQSFANGRGEWTLAGYHIVKEKLLVPDPNNPLLQQQIGQQSSKGIELSTSMQVGFGLRVDANLAVLDARYDEFDELVAGVLTSWAGNTPVNVPQRVGSLWLSWKLPQRFLVQGGFRYTGSRYLNNANAVTTPAATVVDANVRRELTNRVSLDVRVTNLLDKFYLQSVSGAPIPLRGRIGPPRALELMLNTKF